MDYYKCEKCGDIFDEFEMDFHKAQIDKKCLCGKCRELENPKSNERDGMGRVESSWKPKDRNLI